jgi:microsomal epoxide hydrolase
MFATPRPEDEIAALVRSVLKTPLEASVALLSYPLPREHWRAIARGLRRPLTYVVTARFAEQARNLQSSRPATRVEVFEQAGHALFVDEPARFNDVLAEAVRTRDA